MDAILNIFKSLDIDQTFFVQFAIVSVLYLVMRSLLFGKLQEVLDLREEKTTKMEDGAAEKLNKAEKLAKEYKEKIDGAKGEAFKIVTSHKDSVISREATKIKEHETKLEAEADTKRSEFAKEIASKKEAIMQQADSLSQDLVTKIVQ
jgi:F-type H+-transporting ATPase subunit b